ncbi:GNAT family N-acetyltransferase [Paracoccus aminophilus]|uniref:Putative siderophore biosynthesis protein n=1 Tax=Paracoccus aminophilus JCM 7686 TaxID=1367847 RepID=S5YH01_PARAH|nr:GNAT family N-acetyltransferase [Paracoccus aminophilus]AGT10748.1 putative siderophore biosynthesis protein [Paracoccus aminophilus JCM 7686]
MTFDLPPFDLPDPFLARRDGARILLAGPAPQSLGLRDAGEGRLWPACPEGGLPAALAVFEALSAGPDEVVLMLDPAPWAALLPELHARGIAVPFEGAFAVFPALFWQVPDRWLAHAAPPFPELFRRGPHGRHPLRPPKPEGLLYRRFIPWLGQWLTLRALDLDDLPTFHRWQNDPRVAAFFEESGTLDQHRALIERMLADPHLLPVIGALDGRDFGYFELYWARENRLGAVHDCAPWDRGWHVLIGEEDIRGAEHVTAWLPALMHYMFLSEPRTRTILGEPKASHVQQLRNLTRGGFGKIRDFDFSHKRAALVALDRQHFFDARLWARPPESDGRPLRLSPTVLL